MRAAYPTWSAPVVLVAVVLATGAGCDDTSDPAAEGPCPQGICGSGSGANGSGGNGSGGDAGCTEAWTCTDWVQGSDGLYSRTCTDGNACGTTQDKPPEGPIALPDLDVDYYKCQVEPIVDRLCAHMGCHGTDQGRLYRVYARGRLRNNQVVPPSPGCLGTEPVNLQDVGSGTIMCEGWSAHTAEEWQKNYDSARTFMVGISDPADSELLKQPLIGGGFAHAGVHTWSAGDPAYQTIVAWLGGATQGPCDPGPN